MSNQKHLRCPNCRSSFPEDFINLQKQCPTCLTRAQPRDPRHDLDVNWEDVRILTMLASRYLSSVDNLPPALVEEYTVILRSLNAKRPLEAPLLEI